jgi:hypothetical protein
MISFYPYNRETNRNGIPSQVLSAKAAEKLCWPPSPFSARTRNTDEVKSDLATKTRFDKIVDIARTELRHQSLGAWSRRGKRIRIDSFLFLLGQRFL